MRNKLFFVWLIKKYKNKKITQSARSVHGFSWFIKYMIRSGTVLRTIYEVKEIYWYSSRKRFFIWENQYVLDT